MNLIKTSSLNAIAVIVRMLSLLGINKILALYVGPVGYVFVGQFYNTVQILTTFAGGAANQGVVRYTSEYQSTGDQKTQNSLWRTAGSLSLALSLLSLFFLIIFRSQLSIFFFETTEYSVVFSALGVGIPFLVFNNLFLAILNGRKEIKKFVIANIIGSILSLFLTFLLTKKVGLKGALIALGTYQSLAFVSTAYFCLKLPWFKFSSFFGSLDKNILKQLLKYALMALFSTSCLPIAQILIRSYLADSLGNDLTGLWEAMIRLSSAFIMLITSTLAVYYLPRVSEIKDKTDLHKEIKNFFKIIFPITLLISSITYLMRDFIIGLLFSKNFIQMRELFGWQFLGEAIKVCGWLLGFIAIARGNAKIFITSEILFSFLLVGLNIVLVPIWGLKGTSIAYTLNYIGYFIFLFFSLRKVKVI